MKIWIELDCGTAPPTNFKTIVARRHPIYCECAMFVGCSGPCGFARQEVQPYLGELQRFFVEQYAASDCVAAYRSLAQSGIGATARLTDVAKIKASVAPCILSLYQRQTAQLSRTGDSASLRLLFAFFIVNE